MRRHHEFWNTHIFHLPIYLYWLYLSVRARSLFFFSAANPGIENGGLMGESKYKILTKIDQSFLPRMVFFKHTENIEHVLEKTSNAGIHFPFIVKPDIGQGGWLIDLIRDQLDLSAFLKKIKIPFIVQEYIDEPVEVGLLYYRFPGETNGVISSLSIKELLHVIGNGRNTLLELIESNDRAYPQLKRLACDKRIDLSFIPGPGVKVPLSFVGNHSYGTVFKNACNDINDKLVSVFDDLCRRIEGFYFGRFDIRCKNIEDLNYGRFKILELNGVGSEPLHIFDPNHKLMEAYKVALHHWKVIYQISMANCSNRTPFLKLKDAWRTYQNVLKIQRLHESRIVIGN